MMEQKTLRGDRCKCPSCGCYFNSTAAFDKHRTGSYKKQKRRCLTFTEMSDIGMSLNKDEFWITRKFNRYQ